MDQSNDNQATTASSATTTATTNNILFVIGLIVAVFGAVIVISTVPAFKKMFQGFGADVPFVTRLALNYYQAIWLLPIIVTIVRLIWPDIRARSKAALIVGVVGVFVCWVALVVAIYLPIFKLGQAV